MQSAAAMVTDGATGPKELAWGPPASVRAQARDRRDSYRLEVAPGAGRIHVSRGDGFSLKDLSAGGSSVILEGGQIANNASLRAVFELGTRGAFAADLRVLRVGRLDDGSLELGTQFQDLSMSARRVLSRFMIEEFQRRSSSVTRLVDGPSMRVSDPAFIANLFRRRAGEKAQRLQVLENGRVLDVRLLSSGLDLLGGHEVIRAALLGDSPQPAHGREYVFLMSSAGAVTVFSSRVLGASGRTLWLSLPKEVLQAGSRQSVRTPVLPGSNARLVASLARDPGEPLLHPLYDVAARGLSFLVDVDRNALFPGDRLDEVIVAIGDERIETTGVIRSLVAKGDRGLHLCGVELTDFSGTQAARRWHHFVFRHLHPRLAHAGANDSEAAWEILRSSEYVNLWVDEAERRHIHRAFLTDWSSSSPDTGSLLLLKTGRGPVGMISGSSLYPRTWLMHHLAVDSSERTPQRKAEFLAMADELYSGITYTLTHMASARYFVAYFERNKSWNKYLYEQFIDRYVRKEDQLYDARTVYRRSTEQPVVDEQLPGAARVVAADQALLNRLSASLARSVSPMEFDAFSYAPEEIDLRAFAGTGAGSGVYERQRHVYVALDDQGEALGAVICESGGEGVNIFGLLNTCWLVAMDRPLEEPVVRALLGHSVQHYRRLGKQRFVLLEKPGELGRSPSALGFEFVSDGVRWLARTGVLPVWRSYVEEIMAVREPAAAANDVNKERQAQ